MFYLMPYLCIHYFLRSIHSIIKTYNHKWFKIDSIFNSFHNIRSTLDFYGKTILSKHFYKLEKLKLIDFEIVKLKLIDFEIVIIVILKINMKTKYFGSSCLFFFFDGGSSCLWTASNNFFWENPNFSYFAVELFS